MKWALSTASGIAKLRPTMGAEFVLGGDRAATIWALVFKLRATNGTGIIFLI